MTVTVEGKLELFKKVLFEHIEEDWTVKRNKLIEALEENKEEKRKEFEKRKKAIVKDGESRAEAKRKSIISKAQGDADQEIMDKREALLKSLIEALKDWCKDFIKGDKYKEFLGKNIEDSLNLMKGQNLLFCFTKKDLDELKPFIKEQIEKSENKKNIELTASKEDIIGGFTVEDKDSDVLADFCIKTLIEESKEYMGRILYEKLDEVLKA